MKMRFLIGVTGLMLSIHSLAAVDCIGVPQATKVGEFGANEGFLFVLLNGTSYKLGNAENDQPAKLRMALATTALVSKKRLLLRFWDPYTDCDSASGAGAVPNSVQLLE